MKSVKDKDLIVTMSNGQKWSVPVHVIAYSRSKHYAHEFDDDVVRSADEDTWPLFESDENEIKDWAANNMNWEDVMNCAMLLPSEYDETDYQEEWVNGKREIR